MPDPGGLVVCFSYLAAANLWQVGRFPAANRGAEVRAIEESIAADGPMVAAVLTALGQPSLLLANNVGNDVSGIQVRNWLERYGVATTAETEADIPTPQIVVVGDSHHTRTLFPYLPGVADQLARVDLAPFASAAFAYVDCYALIQRSAVRAIHSTRSADVPLLLNLGGDQVSSDILTALRGYPRLILQTNITDASLETAARLAKYMQADVKPEWAVITAGAAGAAAASARDLVRAPAFRADVRHTHCAGAAFSGGLVYGLLRGWPMQDSLDLASASGALRCERAHHEHLPSLDQLARFMYARERSPTPAA